MWARHHAPASYGYDLAGNALTVNGNTFATYDAANKFATLSGGTVAYDGDGNTTSITGANVPSGTWTWDDRGFAVSATGGDGSVVAYGYNAGGMRVRSQAGSGAPVFYIFDGSTLVGEVYTGGNSGAVRAAYTWGANGLVSERVFAANGAGRSLWYAYDVQGATRALTDAGGQVADTYQYLPYGTLLSQRGRSANAICGERKVKKAA